MSLSTVHILLATYNGEHYLPQQWASAEAQRGVDVVLHLADDGSIDEIMALLRELSARRRGARSAKCIGSIPRHAFARQALADYRHQDVGNLIAAGLKNA
jgi:glycosyltransferase involved in cell wall biosynthesis